MEDGKHAEGWIAFATILAATAGVANALFGMSWLFAKETFPQGGVIYVTAQEWGWILVIFGALQVIAAFMLIARKNYGRIFTIIIAAISLLAWTGWAGQLPFAGAMALVFDVLVIYGLSVTRQYFE